MNTNLRRKYTGMGTTLLRRPQEKQSANGPNRQASVTLRDDIVRQRVDGVHGCTQVFPLATFEKRLGSLGNTRRFPPSSAPGRWSLSAACLFMPQLVRVFSRLLFLLFSPFTSTSPPTTNAPSPSFSVCCAPHPSSPLLGPPPPPQRPLIWTSLHDHGGTGAAREFLRQGPGEWTK